HAFDAYSHGPRVPASCAEAADWKPRRSRTTSPPRPAGLDSPDNLSSRAARSQIGGANRPLDRTEGVVRIAAREQMCVFGEPTGVSPRVRRAGGVSPRRKLLWTTPFP